MPLQIRLHGEQRAETVNGGVCHGGSHDGAQHGQCRGSGQSQRCAAGESAPSAQNQHSAAPSSSTGL